MKLEPHRPIEHQQIIALLKEAQPPPADAETPSIPDEVLDRLRGQYGRAPRRAIVEDQPSVWAWFCDFFVQPTFALATVLVLLCGVTAIMQRPAVPTAEDLLRGGKPHTAAIPAYWLQSAQGETAPTGLGLPKFIVITASDSLPTKGDALIFDPAHHEARALKDGTLIAQFPITDTADSNEWLNAHRQLSQLPAP